MLNPPVKNALISVSDKAGLAEFARGLVAAGVTIYSTGGTRKFLQDQGIPAVEVSAYTGFPEMMDGRLKTLHPKIFGGILVRHDRPSDLTSIAEHGIETFELVVVNLYPFAATIAREGVTWEQAIEQIDIGGPSLVRAAGKNHAFTSIATCAEQYPGILAEIQNGGCTTLETRKRLAAEAFAHTAAYDRTIADYFASKVLAPAKSEPTTSPAEITLSLSHHADLRYGENSHQKAAVYSLKGFEGTSLVKAKQLSGKELSYNNLLDLDSALAIVRHYKEPACSVIKHNNPCGAAIASTLSVATQKALAGDPQSAFGGVLAMNRPIDAATAEVLAKPGLFIEAIVAPSFDAAAVEILTTRPKWKANVRLLEVGSLQGKPTLQGYRQIEGGMLVQEADVQEDPESEWKVVTQKAPADALLSDLRFGFGIVRFVKSNAIILAKNGSLIGCGAGQMSRVDSVEIAIQKAGANGPGAILASDAFFPFPDSIHRAAAAGVAAIIQPGGSVKDAEVIAACNDHGIPMILTGRRHFKH